LKFRRQHVVEGFVVDFYCDEHKIAIEVDGGIHNNRLDYDNAREDVIRSEGITLVRIKNEDVLRDELFVISKIKEVLQPKH